MNNNYIMEQEKRLKLSSADAQQLDEVISVFEQKKRFREEAEKLQSIFPPELSSFTGTAIGTRTFIVSKSASTVLQKCVAKEECPKSFFILSKEIPQLVSSSASWIKWGSLFQQVPFLDTLGPITTAHSARLYALRARRATIFLSSKCYYNEHPCLFSLTPKPGDIWELGVRITYAEHSIAKDETVDVVFGVD